MTQSLEVLAELGELPDELEIRQIMTLWHGPKWNRRDNAAALADWVRINRAIRTEQLGSRAVEVPPSAGQARARAVPFRGFGRYQYSVGDDLDRIRRDRLWKEAQAEKDARQSLTEVSYHVRRNQLRAWFARNDTPCPSKQSLIWRWFPDQKASHSGKPKPLYLSDLVPEVLQVRADEGVGQAEACRKVAARYPDLGIDPKNLARRVRALDKKARDKAARMKKRPSLRVVK